MVRLKGFEPSRDYLPLRPQRMGRIGFRPAALGPQPPHNVGYELVKSFDGFVVANIPTTVNPMMGCITPSQYLAARNLKKVEAKFAL